jgi:two-component system cell cycle sensor histidine kinase/response regulator CckA
LLYEQLDLNEVEPLEGGLRWLMPGLVAAAAASGALLFFMIGQPIYGGLFLAGFVGMLVAAFVIDRRGAKRVEVEPVILPDLALVGSALSLSPDAAVITAADGTLRSVNAAYKTRFGGTPDPLEAGKDKKAAKLLANLRDVALRDGSATAEGVQTRKGPLRVEASRVGIDNGLLLWRFAGDVPEDPLDVAAKRIAGQTGERLRRRACLRCWSTVRAGWLLPMRSFQTASRRLRFDQAAAIVHRTRRSDRGRNSATARRRARRAADQDRQRTDRSWQWSDASTVLMFDAEEGPSLASSTNVQVLLEMLPIGLALVDRDGRFLMMNKAFRQAGGIPGEEMPSYPGDLVVKEDKAAVADAVRRNARGPAMSGDLPVRLAHQPTEPVALTVAGLRGLGDAAVLLLLKDNSEEAKLKRQIAQATKMQAVGQLAGGVAHDFNNILTAIIGHCDLMLMRHTPGDTDYDDLQQIKSNSNRAAGLTRQLLAFSRQQTLRPQVLQLPDVISEVSHLLKRLLGETVQLILKHGRDLGPVRADPGQLEQVIVNLAVNARDAMASKGGGTLTIQTYSVKATRSQTLAARFCR